MAGLTPSVISQLKEKFSDLVILTPETPEYEENMLRWNVAAEHKAVSLLFVPESLVNSDSLGCSDLSCLDTGCLQRS
jgi:hypothetical protein